MIKGKSGIYKKVFKPLMDWLFALILIILASPIMLVFAIMVKNDDGGKVLFKQQRPGKNEKLFTLLKFRTMSENKELENKTEHDMDRMTKTGRFLRKFSLDETPQFINILKGEMSLIGPRPLLPEYIEFYSKEQRKRHSVKPGMTGLAQVLGRNSSTWDDRLAADIEYADNIGFILDFKILLKTFGSILSGRDVNSSTKETMMRFDDYVRNKK